MCESIDIFTSDSPPPLCPARKSTAPAGGAFLCPY